MDSEASPLIARMRAALLPPGDAPIETENALAAKLHEIMHWGPDDDLYATPGWSGNVYFDGRMAIGTELISDFVKSGRRILNNTGAFETTVAAAIFAFYGPLAWDAAQFEQPAMTDDVLFAIVRGGPKWIARFKEAGLQFRVCQDEEGQTLVMATCGTRMKSFQKRDYKSDENLIAYLDAGGPPSDLKDMYGNTEAHIIVSAAPSALSRYLKAGGVIPDTQNSDGYTVSMAPLASDARMTRLYIQQGGRFFPGKRDRLGRSEALISMFHGALETYLEEGKEAGAQFTGVTEWDAVGIYDPNNAMLFYRYGSRFTKAVNAAGKTSGDVAREHINPRVLEAYEACVKLQGGLLEAPPPEQASAPACRI